MDPIWHSLPYHITLYIIEKLKDSIDIKRAFGYLQSYYILYNIIIIAII